MIKKNLHVGPDYKAAFECVLCGNRLALDLSGGVKGTVELELHCACDQEYSVVVSRRRFQRRDVQLDGLYRRTESEDWRSMTVNTLSRGGLGFKITQGESFTSGESLVVRFHLWDKGPEPQKSVIVRDTVDRPVGVEFLPGNDPDSYQRYCDTALALYTLEATSATAGDGKSKAVQSSAPVKHHD